MPPNPRLALNPDELLPGRVLLRPQVASHKQTPANIKHIAFEGAGNSEMDVGLTLKRTTSKSDDTTVGPQCVGDYFPSRLPRAPPRSTSRNLRVGAAPVEVHELLFQHSTWYKIKVWCPGGVSSNSGGCLFCLAPSCSWPKQPLGRRPEAQEVGGCGVSLWNHALRVQEAVM